MQQAAYTMHIYCATWTGRLQHGHASIPLALTLLLLLLLLLLAAAAGMYSSSHSFSVIKIALPQAGGLMSSSFLTVLEIEVVIAFAMTDLHLDCLDRSSAKSALISIINRDLQDGNLYIYLRSFPPRSNNAVIGCCVCMFRCNITEYRHIV